ncbi:MAG: ABC transporter permease [Phycisphaerales bacterium]
MQKVIQVALREFLATVLTKAFIIGVAIVPLIMLAAITLIPLLMNKAGPAAEGRIAVIDQSGDVGEGIKSNLDYTRIKPADPAEFSKALDEAQQRGFINDDIRQKAESAAPMAAAAIAQNASKFTVEILDPGADVEAAKRELLATPTNQIPRLAVVVVPRNAVVLQSREQPFAGFELFTAPKVAPEVEDRIRDGIAGAIIDARLRETNLDGELVHRIMDRPRATTRTVTTTGERSTNQAAAFFLPMGFMMLLWVSVFTAGQGLLTTTIEEKSSRIMEVLLSAASPIQIMTGKIIGQMGVGAVIMGVYSVLGVGSLMTFHYMHLLEWTDLGLLLVYFAIAFFTVASMMAAIGSAVNDIREAQSLMTPVMLVLMIPMILWLPISRAPNSTLAQVLSLTPPVSPFVMVVRIAGAEEVPVWQIPASIVIGIATVYASIWLCAKIFRIGVLMYGKPPNFKTLVRWIRMA